MNKVKVDGLEFYIETYVQKYEDGNRIIIIGGYIHKQKEGIVLITTDAITSQKKGIVLITAAAITSPKDAHNSELGLKIVAGRIAKGKTITTTVIVGKTNSEFRNNLMKMSIDNAARNVAMGLAKKYKIVRDDNSKSS